MTVTKLGGGQEARHEDRIRMVTGDTFAALVIEGRGPIVVEFMSYGCAHCRAIEPILQRVAGGATFRGVIFRVNVAAEQQLASAYDIAGTPTLIMFLAGKEVGREEGPRPTEASLLAVMTRPFAA